MVYSYSYSHNSVILGWSPHARILNFEEEQAQRLSGLQNALRILSLRSERRRILLGGSLSLQKDHINSSKSSFCS